MHKNTVTAQLEVSQGKVSQSAQPSADGTGELAGSTVPTEVAAVLVAT